MHDYVGGKKQTGVPISYFCVSLHLVCVCVGGVHMRKGKWQRPHRQSEAPSMKNRHFLETVGLLPAVELHWVIGTGQEARVLSSSESSPSKRWEASTSKQQLQELVWARSFPM